MSESNVLLKSIKLKTDGSNIDSYFFKLENILKKEDLLPALFLNVSFQPKGGDAKDVSIMDVINDPTHWRLISNLTPTSLEKAIPSDEDAATTKQRHAAYTIVTSTIPDTLTHLIRTKPRDPAVAIAVLREHFTPTDHVTVHQLYDKMSKPSLDNYDNDVMKLAVDLKSTYLKLQKLGEKLSENFLVNSLLQALPNNKYGFIIQLIRREKDKKTFEEIVSEIHSHLRNNTTLNSSAPKVEAAMRIFDRKLNKITKKFSLPSQTHYNLKSKSNLNKQKRYLKNKRNRGTENRSKSTCNYCKKTGHHRNDCYRWLRDQGKPPPSNYTCKFCKKTGHWQDKCYSNKNKRFKPNKEQSLFTSEIKSLREDMATFLGTKQNEAEVLFGLHDTFPPKELGQITLCVDSGASVNLVDTKEFFDYLTPVEPVFINVGKKGHGFTVNRMGPILVHFVNSQGQRRPGKITAYYAPEAPSSFLSTPQLDKQGYTLVQKSGNMSIRRDNREITFAKRTGGAFWLTAKLRANPSPTLTASCTEELPPLISQGSKDESLNRIDIYQIHRQLGHASIDKIKKTIKATTGITLPARLPRRIDCATCDLTKEKRMPVSKSNKSTPLNSRLHCDLKFGMKKSIRGYRGYSLLVHEGSRRVTVNPLKHKSETTSYIKAFIERAEKKDNTRITELRCDGGGEYVNNELINYLKLKGIAFTPSPPHTPEKNAIAERTIQSLQSIVRSTLKQSKLSQSFWCFAAQAAAYTFNRLTHSFHDLTPHEVFTGTKPDLTTSVTFGAIGVAHVEKAKRKLGGLADRGIFVRMLGYDSRKNTYLVATVDNKLLRLRVRKWYQNVFKFPTISTQNKTPIILRGEKSVNLDVRPNPPASVPEQEIKFRPTPTISVSNKPAIFPNLSVDTKIETKLPPGDIKVSIPPNEVNTSPTFHDDDVMELVEEEPPSPRRFRPTRGTKSFVEHPKYGKVLWNLGKQKISVHDIENLPTSYEDATTCDEKTQWSAAIEKQMKALIDNNTFKLHIKPVGTKLLDTKWVWKKKNTSLDFILFKARLCARGFLQQHGINYFNSYAPTLSLISLRMLLGYASKYGFSIHNADIDAAYLNGVIDCDVYLQIPKGYIYSEEERRQMNSEPNATWCLKLQKGIYGLVQSGYIWRNTFIEFIQSIGFSVMKSDPCILVYRVNSKINIIIGLYVDDLIILYKVKIELDKFLAQLKQRFAFKDLGPLTATLGVEVTRNKTGAYSISQQKYINNLKEKYNILPSKRAKTPLTAVKDLFFPANTNPVDPLFYRSIVGALQYLAAATRPDISHAVSLLSSFAQKPTETHYEAAYRLAKYVVNTASYKISFKTHSLPLEGFADASFNTDPESSKSITGFVLFGFGGPISWKSRKQKIVATSTCEAEYVAASLLTREIIYSKQLLEELNVTFDHPITLHTDSTAAMSVATKEGTQKSKSIRLKYHNVRQAQRDRVIKLTKILGTLNVADLLTKPLTREQTERHSNTLFNDKQLKDDHLHMISRGESKQDRVTNINVISERGTNGTIGHGSTNTTTEVNTATNASNSTPATQDSSTNTTINVPKTVTSRRNAHHTNSTNRVENKSRMPVPSMPRHANTNSASSTENKSRETKSQSTQEEKENIPPTSTVTDAPQASTLSQRRVPMAETKSPENHIDETNYRHMNGITGRRRRLRPLPNRRARRRRTSYNNSSSDDTQVLL